MDKTIFREKSIERVSSPEELNSYIKSTSPKLWVVLGAIIIFLVGIIIWGTVGRIESGKDVGCVVRDGQFECLIDEETYSKIVDDPYVVIDNGNSGTDITIDGPYQATEDDYMFHVSGIKVHDWYYAVYGNIKAESGNHMGFFVTESVRPIKFIFN